MTEEASRTSAYYSSSVASFLADGPSTILGILTAAHAHDLEVNQRGAWEAEIGILKDRLLEKVKLESLRRAVYEPGPPR